MVVTETGSKWMTANLPRNWKTSKPLWLRPRNSLSIDPPLTIAPKNDTQNRYIKKRAWLNFQITTKPPTLPCRWSSSIPNRGRVDGRTNGADGSDLRTNFGPFNVEFTRKQGDGTELAEAAAKAGQKFIIACGGDALSTKWQTAFCFRAVMQSLACCRRAPAGIFAGRSVYPLRTVTRPGASRWATKNHDAGRVTFQDFDDKTVSRYFVNVSSFGLAARSLNGSNRPLPWDGCPSLGRGRAGFALSTLQEVHRS